MRWAQLVFAVPAAVVAWVVVHEGTRMTNAGWLLTATSILTGLTFSMTTTFWAKSIEARRNPQYATNADVLNALDDNRTHLMWTVFIGVTGTGVLAITGIFADPVKGAPVAVTAVASAMLVYLITLVGVALQRFAEAAFTLR